MSIQTAKAGRCIIRCLWGVEIIYNGLSENEQVIFFIMSENEHRMNIRSGDIGLFCEENSVSCRSLLRKSFGIQLYNIVV
jgi:hypothetical protein